MSVFLISLSLQAQQVVSSEALDIRNRLEKEVQQNLTSLISTQLEPTTFTVAVRVQLSPITPPKDESKKKDKAEEPPAGLDLGLIHAQELIDSYERELEELKLKKEAVNKKDQEEKFQLSKIEVLVGLSEIYPEGYVKTFSAWLTPKMKKDYGSIASSQVSKIKKFEPKPKLELDKNGKPIDPQTTKTEAQEKEDAQNLFDDKILIAFGVVGLALILLGVLLRSGLNKVATSTKPIQIDPKGEWNIRTANDPNSILLDENSAANALTLGKAETYALHEELDKQIKKIAFVCLEINSKLNDLVRVWIDTGEEGLTKTAILIDAILSARERILTETGSIAPISIPLDEELAASHEEELAEAYRQVVDMEIEEKIKLLDKVYWDLVSVKTLGLQCLRRPFDFLKNMSETNLLEIIDTQKSDAQAMAMMYLPKEQKESILKDFDADKKESIIKNMLLNSQVSQKQIWDLDTSVKVSVLNQSASPTERLVNLFPRTVEVLQSLNDTDEIHILRRVAPSLPEQGLVLKQQYTTLAFMDEWKPEYIRKLSQISTADELVAVIRLLPSTKESILAECAPKIKTIVEDDLNLPAPSNLSQLRPKLSSLKAKWTRLVLNENIPMSKVLQPARRQEVPYAA